MYVHGLLKTAKKAFSRPWYIFNLDMLYFFKEGSQETNSVSTCSFNLEILVRSRDADKISRC